MTETNSGNTLFSSAEDERFLRAIFYDPLTGLLSMTRFYELCPFTMEAIEARGERPTMIYLDLSGMKHYNRRHGFDRGDELLRRFSALLLKYFEGSDCSRFGQDHFVVNTGDLDLNKKLEHLFEEWREQCKSDGAFLPIRVGIYQRAHELIGFAAACDRAKIACDSLRSSHASGIRYFTEDLLAELELRQFVLDNFETALEEKRFRVYYQPIVRSLNGTVCNEECLSRWEDPDRGLLSPGAFIPVLEEANLIYKLDLYVVDQVLEKICFLSGKGFPIKTHSINLSRSDFFTCDIVEEVRSRVDAAGVARDRIALEITESTIGSDLDYITDRVKRFRALGFPVWIDDFGSGYSSLDVLQSMDFDLIKFDMMFMKKFSSGVNGRIILTELLRMATALNVDTICEGVENEEQVLFLREAGCSKMQGFFYGKAKPQEKILELHETGKQIGFENPDEYDYYESVGRANLYDLVSFTTDGCDQNDRFQNYFSSLPMAVLEISRSAFRFVRTNHSFRDFITRMTGLAFSEKDNETGAERFCIGRTCMDVIKRCASDGGSFFLDNTMPDHSVAHMFIKKLADNPVTHASAVKIAVLSVMDTSRGASYEHIARALAADYFNLFYVDLEDESYIEYSSDVGVQNIAVERRGEHFFRESIEAAQTLIHKDDLKGFLSAFTKENILRALQEQGTFRLTYRMMREGEPFYVSMKAMGMDHEHRNLIIGVSNIDLQMNRQASYEKLRREQAVYSRINALFGEFICLYTIDPASDYFIQSSATTQYENLGIALEGQDFFRLSRENGKRAVAPEDLEFFLQFFTKENILREICRTGIFTRSYHLVLDGDRIPVELRAALVQESDGDRLILGLLHRDAA